MHKSPNLPYCEEAFVRDSKRDWKKACRIHIDWGTSLDKAVEILLNKKEDGKDYFMIFNWIKLSSADIKNIDDAYLLIHGETKAQVEMRKEKERQNFQAEEMKQQLQAIENIPWWIEDGKKLIERSKWWNWEEYVNRSARGPYKWMDISIILESLKLIDNWESWEHVRERIYDENLTAISYSALKEQIVYFSKRGKDAQNNI